MATSDKLQAILNSKENIRQAINNKGVTVDEEVVFADYGEKIDQITTGGGGTPINNQNKNITANGVYTADAGYTGLGTVNVNVSGGGSGTPNLRFGATKFTFNEDHYEARFDGNDWDDFIVPATWDDGVNGSYPVELEGYVDIKFKINNCIFEEGITELNSAIFGMESEINFMYIPSTLFSEDVYSFDWNLAWPDPEHKSTYKFVYINSDSELISDFISSEIAPHNFENIETPFYSLAGSTSGEYGQFDELRFSFTEGQTHINLNILHSFSYSSLKSLRLPSTTTHLEGYVDSIPFDLVIPKNCVQIKSSLGFLTGFRLIMLPTTPPDISEGSVSNASSIIVPNSALNAYKNDEYWNMWQYDITSTFNVS